MAPFHGARENHYYRWGLTLSDSQTNTPFSAGWTIADASKVKIDTAAWLDHGTSHTGMLAVKADVLTPSLTAAAITSSGATLTLADYSGTWYYKRIEPALTTCNTASTPTVTLSTLDANKLYGYTAYSNSTCATALDTVYFSTSSAFVGNLAEADNSFCALGNVNGLTLCTTAFTTGSNSLGYTLGAVTARFSSKVNSPGAIVAAIHAADTTNSSNPAATASITLSGSDPDADGLHTFTCSTNCDLAGSTTYFVVFSSPTTATNFQYYRWMITLADAEALWPAGSGWAIADVGRYKSGTNAWAAMTIDRSGVMHVRATAKTASLAASYVTATTARLTISGHTGNWYYKHTFPTSGTCSSTAVSGTTTTATGLGPATDYTFAAYSDSSCNNTLATASSFTTADVSVSKLSETTGAGAFTVGRHTTNAFIEGWATEFTTGSHTHGYTLTTVIAKFNAKNGTPGNITAKIHADGSSDAPGTEVANLTLTGTTSPDNENAEYACSGAGCSLAASTTYHLAFRASDESLNAGVNYQWAATTSDTETKTPSTATGWALGNGSSQWNSSWSGNVNQNTSGRFSISANEKSSGQSVGNAAPVVAGWRLERGADGVLRVMAAPGRAAAVLAPGSGNGAPGSASTGNPDGPSTPDTPSAAPGAPDPASDLSALAAAGNTSPDGLWSDGVTMWVVDTDDRMLYAYDLATQSRDAAKDVVLWRNTHPLGLASDGVTLWVSDHQADTLYAYPVPGASSAPAADLTLHPLNASPSALWTDGATLWVAEDTDSRLYAYDLSDGARAPSQDLTLHPDNASSGGLWSDGVTMWVSDPDDGHVYAYRLSDGARDASLDYVVSDESARVYGLWSDGWTLWMVDDGSDRVVGYRAH